MNESDLDSPEDKISNTRVKGVPSSDEIRNGDENTTVGYQEKERSNQDPTLNARKIIFNIAEEEKTFENDIENKLVGQRLFYDGLQSDVAKNNETENSILDARVGFSGENINGGSISLEDLKAKKDLLFSDEKGPKRQEQNVFSQYSYQTAF